jgi:hypothetical protein
MHLGSVKITKVIQTEWHDLSNLELYADVCSPNVYASLHPRDYVLIVAVFNSLFGLNSVHLRKWIMVADNQSPEDYLKQHYN